MRRLLAVAVLLLFAGCAWIERSSVPANSMLGTEGNGYSGLPSLSQTGAVVAFQSVATNLVPGDTNGVLDVFVRESATSITERVSVTDDGTQANGPSQFPGISDDGNMVVFQSRASNLVPNDNDNKADVFVRDRARGTTTMVSIQPNGEPFADEVVQPEISGNGRFVSFSAFEPFGAYCCGLAGPYVRDLVNGTTTLMPSVEALGVNTTTAPLSDDGTRIVYVRVTPLEDPRDVTYTVAVADTTTATVVATVAGGTLLGETRTLVMVGLSGNGRVAAVLYETSTGGSLMIYDFDAPALRELLANLKVPSNVELSDKGNVIALKAEIAGLAGWYVTNPAGTSTTNLSADARGLAATIEPIEGALSGNGKWVAFSAGDAGMIEGDTNGAVDVFTRSVKPSQSGPAAPVGSGA
jgi:hypothetical protein